MSAVVLTAVALLAALCAINLLLTLSLAHKVAGGEAGPAHASESMPAGPKKGAWIPDFVATTAQGVPLRRRDLEGSPSLVAFTLTGCRACRELVADLRAAELPQDTKLFVFAATMAGDDLAEHLAGLPQSAVLVPIQSTDSAPTAFRIAFYPTVLLLDADGVVGESGR
jgi:hypothetical protein